MVICIEDLDYIGSFIAVGLGALCGEPWAYEKPPWEAV